MEIRVSKGVELEKTLKNSPEDFFNRSDIVYEDKGTERKFSLLYLRYFDEKVHEFTPFESNPIMTYGDVDVELKDVAAFIAFIKNPGYKHRKKVYINEYEDYKKLFSDVNWEAVKQAYLKLSDGKSFEMESTLDFIRA
ncbi:hypothetical protein [Thalassobacillus pellis]|uniref:hypothetical protein n=1 Tax=Thalassobacillus pellis TaxID=748008 RepID=UPI0019612B34|nr:hypothetical protein [Thalassobacillus pellis]MBM7552412.1 hypothetical protein [Thalassobacillus pellis]